MARAPERRNWLRASRIASAALNGYVFPGVGLATHYHTTAIWPRWGKSLVMTNIVGAHIFHRWRGRWGMPDAFRAPYMGREPVPGPYLPLAQQLAIQLLVIHRQHASPAARVAGATRPRGRRRPPWRESASNRRYRQRPGRDRGAAAPGDRRGSSTGCG